MAGALLTRARIRSCSGNRQVHFSAEAYFAPDIEASADDSRALVHPRQAEVSRPLMPVDRGVNALPVVSHAHSQLRVAVLNPHVDSPGVCVAVGVAQRLGSDSVGVVAHDWIQLP